jgi:flagellar protein FlaG
MNTINTNSVVHSMATDGQALYQSSSASGTFSNKERQIQQAITPTGAQVAQSIEQNLAETKADSQQLQKMSDMIDGRKVQFNVNKELNTVVVKIVDSNTNQVLKEIPSEDMQKLKLRIRKAIGNLYDELV